MPPSTDPADQLRGGDPPVIVSTGALLLASETPYLVTAVKLDATQGEQRIILTIEEL